MYADASYCLKQRMDDAIARIETDPYRWFWQYVEFDGHNGCWIWVGSRLTNGYGFISVGPKGEQKRLLVHRVAYTMLVGPIPDETPQLDHLCREHPCIRAYDHLEPVTNRENVRRGVGPWGYKERPWYCPQGHLRTENPVTGRRWCTPCSTEQQRVRKTRYAS